MGICLAPIAAPALARAVAMPAAASSVIGQSLFVAAAGDIDIQADQYAAALATWEVDHAAWKAANLAPGTVVVAQAAEIEAVASAIAMTATSRIPDRYVPATWRNITPIDPDTASCGLGFVTDQSKVFLRLSVAEMQVVRDVITEQLDHLLCTNSHSESSSGSPSSTVENPAEGIKVCPPTRSSSAEAAEW